jgi:4-amino-4-deoxy-L-arabinose transferase-like glycosyltransferase
MAAMRNGRWRYWGPLTVVLVVAFLLRLWGIGQGLPYVYNVDEYGHFVPEAVAMFHHGLNPHYFINPPALTYLLHVVFAIWLGGRTGVTREFALHPDRLFLLARITVALLGTVSVWLLYLVGARLFSRGVALLASVLMAVAFLPVFYGHLALNDVPTLAPLTLSLLGTAGVLRRGRALDYLVAGAGIGLASATKYTAGVMVLPLLAATVMRYLEARPDRRHVGTGDPDARSDSRRAVIVGIGIAFAAALSVFLIANPFSVLDFHSFRSELERQSNYTEMSRASWIGAPRQGSFIYYLWSFTWGLGWVPALAALGGAVTLCRKQRRLGWLLVPVAVFYLLFLSLQGRYFGRWLLPIFPVVCLLAAYFSLELAGQASRRAPRLRTTFITLAVLALSAQGLIYSIHSGLLLSRADTRNLTRAWVVEHIPTGARIVVEPVVPNAWLNDTGGLGAGEVRWVKYPTLRLVLNPSNGLPEPPHQTVLLENYERTLGPALIPYYERHGYCWVISGFTQSGRAFADPKTVPDAIRYYKALERQGEVLYRVSPFRPGSRSIAFNFDWTFDYYPLAFERPGPEMTVYRLHGGRCTSVTGQTGKSA